MQAHKHVHTGVGLLAALAIGLAGMPAMAADSHALSGNGPIYLASANEEHHPDTWITTKVKAKLMEQNFFAGMEIKVSTHDGVVQLAGYVKRPEQISLAENIAANVEGVKRVQNDLIIK